MTAGQAATYKLAISSQMNFSGQIALSCSGAPTGATCSITPNLVSLDGSDPVTATVTVQTAAAVVSSFLPAAGGKVMVVAFGSFSLPWIIFLGAHRRKCLTAWGKVASALVCVLVSTMIWSSCGGGGTNGQGGSAGTPAGTYTLAIKSNFTGNGEALSHTMNLTLVVE